MNKICPKCNETRTLDEFRKSRKQCKVCDAAYNIKYKYGLIPEDIDWMLLEQNNCCKICLVNFSEVKLQVDHCHKTGSVRGLLCRMCNSLLGNFKDNPDTLKRAIKYLEEANEVSNI